MAFTQVNCPHCDAVLKPAKPIPGGKKVKCPKCAEIFTVALDNEAQAIQSKPKPSPKAAAVGHGATQEEIDDARQIYGFKTQEQAEAEDDGRGRKKKRKRKEDRNPWDDVDDVDREKRSARGPAAAIVTAPSNTLLRTSLIACICWFANLLIAVFPLLMPLDSGKEKDKNAIVQPDKDKQKAEFDDSEAKEALKILWLVFSFCSLFGTIIGLPYGVVIAVSAVKMQSLESYVWAMIGTIMSLVPIHMVGASMFVLVVGFFAALILPCVGCLVLIVAIFLCVPLPLWGLYAGVRCMIALRDPIVIEGFWEKPKA